MNFVSIGFELGDKMLTLSPMENLIVQCNHEGSRASCVVALKPSSVELCVIHQNIGKMIYLFQMI